MKQDLIIRIASENLDERAYVSQTNGRGSIKKKMLSKGVAKDRKLKKDLVYKEVLDI